ncbi:hypothetical protein OG816_06370 [Streptomyces sp. NBC_00073]|nr:MULTISPECIES: hypothetical protein [unclassified Streptomyces]WSR24690.1 hypothetical protein OG573_00140 [Streptomyces sp. NBC_01205]
MGRVTSVVGSPGTFTRMLVTLRIPIDAASSAATAMCRPVGAP